MSKLIVIILLTSMIISTLGTVSSVKTIYEIYGSINPDPSGNVEDIANSGVVWTAIGATYPQANVLSGTEQTATSEVKNNPNNWIMIVGGPVANSLTKELVDSGKVVENLNGYLKFKNGWGTGTASVILIFGPDRYATKTDCINYADELRAGNTEALLK